MNKTAITTLLLLGVIIKVAGCAGAPVAKNQGDSSIICFQIVEDGSQITIDKNDNETIAGDVLASITISNADGSDPLKTYGEYRDNAFVYADGAKFEITDSSARGVGGLVDGIEAQAVACQ